jgi:hypothetical protein
MLTPFANKLTIKVIGAMIPCQRPPQKPAGCAPGSLYFEYAPATEREFAIAGAVYKKDASLTKQKLLIELRDRRDVFLGGWRILGSSESITQASWLHSGILLWQKRTTPQVSTNISSSG